MRIIVFSQTEGSLDYAKQAIQFERPDYMFHLGHFCEDAEWIQEEFPQIPILEILGTYARPNVKGCKAEEVADHPMDI